MFKDENQPTNTISDGIKESKKRINKKKLIFRVALISTGIMIAAILFIAYQVKLSVDKMVVPTVNKDISINLEEQKDTVTVINPESQEELYFLVMGLDYRDEHNALLTDSIMVIHIIPQASSIKLLSIPRDLLVENTRGWTAKINSLFSEGILLTKQQAKEDPSMLVGDTVKLGSVEIDKAVLSGAMANTRSKIEDLLDIKINYTAVINFSTLVDLVDEVGGIEIDVKRSMKYRVTNLYLEPGLQILNGEEALGYARFRKDDRGSRYYASDFERGMYQQEVVKALADRIFSWENSIKALKLLDIVSSNVQTDMDFSAMYSIFKDYYQTFNSDSFHSVQFPEQYSSSGDVIISDEKLLELQQTFKATE